MGLFSFRQELAIDLGTANTLIIHKDKIIVNEPSIVAIDTMTGKMIAIGEKARQMHGKTHEYIETIRPLRNGSIADFNAAVQMIRGMIKMIKWNLLFTPSLKIVVCIPSGCTEVERRAVRDLTELAGGRNVYMIYEPMAAAIGIGIDVEARMEVWLSILAEGSLKLQLLLLEELSAT
jgi:rod shape-determining protein MreB